MQNSYLRKPNNGKQDIEYHSRVLILAWGPAALTHVLLDFLHCLRKFQGSTPASPRPRPTKSISFYYSLIFQQFDTV
jgi:hypothetical protein